MSSLLLDFFIEQEFAVVTRAFRQLSLLSFVTMVMGCNALNTLSHSRSATLTISSADFKVGFLSDNTLRVAVPDSVQRIAYCRPSNLDGCRIGLGEFITTSTYQNKNGKKFFRSNFAFDPATDHSISLIAISPAGDVIGERRVQFTK